MASQNDLLTDVLAIKQHRANSLEHYARRTRPTRPASAAVNRSEPTLPPEPMKAQAALRRRPSSAIHMPTLHGTPAQSEPDVLAQSPGKFGQPSNSRPQHPPQASTTGPFPWDPTARLGRPRTPLERRAAIDKFFDRLAERHHAPSHKTLTQRNIDGELGVCAPMMGVTRYPYTQTMRTYPEEFSAVVCSSITHPYVTTSVNNSSSIPFNLFSGMAYDDARLSGLKTWHSETERAFQPQDIRASKNATGVGIRSECVQFIN